MNNIILAKISKVINQTSFEIEYEINGVSGLKASALHTLHQPNVGDEILVLVLDEILSTKSYYIILKQSNSIELKAFNSKITITEQGLVIESPKVSITGGTLETTGTVSPDGSGPYCALPLCLFTGAIHVGKLVSGT